jgi:hypothetical protein
MKIGILEAGLLREEMAARFDPYPIMFERFIGVSGRDFEFESFCVIEGEMPASINACDGWLITGSRHGVYDNLVFTTISTGCFRCRILFASWQVLRFR